MDTKVLEALLVQTQKKKKKDIQKDIQGLSGSPPCVLLEEKSRERDTTEEAH